MQKYRVTDTSASLFADAPVVEAASPKKAAEIVHGKVKCSPLGCIVVNRTSSPFRSYTYMKEQVK